MASWKKVLVSGSSIEVNQITASGIPTVDNESNLLAIDGNGSVTQITQGSVAGTNPTFFIETVSGSTVTSSIFNVGSDYLILSHSSDHGFGFNKTVSGTTSSIALHTPQDLKTSAGPTFASITASDGIAHEGDLDTRIEFDTDEIKFYAGGFQMLTLDEVSGKKEVVINQAQADIDFRVESDDDAYLLLTSASSNQVLIGTNSADANSILTVDGTIHTAGITASALPANTTSTTVIVDGGSGKFEKRDLAASISGAIDIATGSLSASIIGTANEVGVTTDGSGNIVIGLTDDVIIPSDLTVTDNLEVLGHISASGDITASGIISSSGDITASGLFIDNDIALGGNLFSFTGLSFIQNTSAVLTGSNVFGSGSIPSAATQTFTGSVLITGSVEVTDGSLSLDDGSITATNGNITATNGDITAANGTGSFGYLTAAEISASGLLFAELPNDTTPISDGVVVYDTATGQLLYTASAAIGVNDYTDLANIPSNIVSASVLSSDGQGSVKLTTNGVAEDITSTVGLETSDEPSFAGLTITGNTALGDGSTDTVTITGNVTASGTISGSSQLFASLSLDNRDLKTVMYDSSTGKFFHTGSYGGGTLGYDELSNIPDNIVSASSFSSNNQGGVTASINGVATSFDVGLQTSDGPTFSSLTITGNTTLGDGSADTVTINGDLIVEGTTTTISTTDLTIEDKFILLASGSSTATSAGIVVSSTAAGTGAALYWDATALMWSVDVAGADGPGNSAASDLKVVTVGHDTTLPSEPGTSGGGNYGNSADDHQKGQLFIDTDDPHGFYVYM